MVKEQQADRQDENTVFVPTGTQEMVPVEIEVTSRQVV